MNDGNDGAPTSPATASALRGPSEAAMELEARAERAQAQESEAAEARRKDAQRALEAEARDNAQRMAGRAPTGFFRSMRFFFVMLVGLVLTALAAANALESMGIPWRVLAASVGVWAALSFVLLLDAKTWRRRLPFSVEGYDAIAGRDSSGDSEAPWVAVHVQVVLRHDAQDARAARARAMDVLTSRCNAMLNKDQDLTPTAGQWWRVHEDGSCRGESTFAIYTTRILEKWMRSEVALLANSHAVDKVIVNAHFTGSSSRISD